MNDLHCPARVFLARHGEAEYEGDLLSDAGGCLTAQGRRQAKGLAESLRAQRIVEVWCSPMSRAVQTAEIVAAALGSGVVVREALREYGVGAWTGTHVDETTRMSDVFDAWMDGDEEATVPHGERIADLAARVVATLAEVADRHRGEAVLVVSHGGAIGSALPVLLGLPPAAARGLGLAPGEVLELEADADGWRAVGSGAPGGFHPTG